MATFFEAEKNVPENAPRQNFVFMAYPFTPPLPAEDYRTAVREMQRELPIRFWYFLDEQTTDEMMRKIWRAVIRADLAVFDISGGNPNVAFELGLAVANGRRCITMLRTGSENPLGRADLGYSERIEYDSIISLKDKLRNLVTSRSSGLGILKALSYELGGEPQQIQQRLYKLVNRVFSHKQVTKKQATEIMGAANLAAAALTKLREKGVLRVAGNKRAARWVFTEQWVYHDHEVTGEEF